MKENLINYSIIFQILFLKFTVIQRSKGHFFKFGRSVSRNLTAVDGCELAIVKQMLLTSQREHVRIYIMYTAKEIDTFFVLEDRKV